MLKKVLPNNSVATPKDILDPLGGIIHCVRMGEEDFVIFEFTPIQKVLDRPKAIEMADHRLNDL